MKFSGTNQVLHGASNSLHIEPEDDEDLWNLFNLVSEGDRIKSRTTRKIKLENSSGTVNVQVKKMVLTLLITKIEYEPSDSSIRFSGKNLTEQEGIRLGQFHTIEISAHDSLSIEKDEWDYIAKNQITLSSQPRGEVAAILMDLNGNAAVYLISNTLVIERGRAAHTGLNKAKAAYGKSDKAKLKFFKQLEEVLTRRLNFDTLKCILLAGPAELRDSFFDWLMNNSSATSSGGTVKLPSHKNKFVKCNAASVSKGTINELLNDPDVQGRMKNTKAIEEFRELAKFHKLHNEIPLRTCYGPGAVALAVEIGAVETLLISDKVLKSNNLQCRVYYAKLSQQVVDASGSVHIIARRGVAGEEMKKLAGIAATLRFPLYDLEGLDGTELPEELKHIITTSTDHD